MSSGSFGHSIQGDTSCPEMERNIAVLFLVETTPRPIKAPHISWRRRAGSRNRIQRSLKKCPKNGRNPSHNCTASLFQLAQHAGQDLLDKLLDLVLLLWLLLLLLLVVLLLRVLMRLLMRRMRRLICAGFGAWILWVAVVLRHFGWPASQVDIDTSGVFLCGILQT